MSSMLETNRYYSARRFLQQGQREWALVIAGELLRSVSGRELALSLLAEMYPGGREISESPSSGSSPDSGGDVTLAGKGQGGYAGA